MGTKSNWVKTSPYGYYRETEDRVKSRTKKSIDKRIHFIAEGEFKTSKHLGSKSLYLIKTFLRQHDRLKRGLGIFG